jgi:predicted small lipoprotein YifL
MNIRFFTIVSLTLIAFTLSSCGMKRALTLPKEEERVDLSADLATHQSIDVLKVN